MKINLPQNSSILPNSLILRNRHQLPRDFHTGSQSSAQTSRILPESHTISLKSNRSRGMVLTKKGWQKLKQAEVFCDRYGNRYTYETLAAQSVLSPRTVSKILNCRVPVDKRTLIIFFNAFHLQLESDDYTIHKIIVTEQVMNMNSPLNSSILRKSLILRNRHQLPRDFHTDSQSSAQTSRILPQSHTISLKSNRSRGMVLTKKGWQKLKQAEVFCDRYGNRYTYETLAAQSVLSPRTVSKILNCRVPVDKRTLIIFFNAFHLQLESDDYTLHKIIVTEQIMNMNSPPNSSILGKYLILRDRHQLPRDFHTGSQSSAQTSRILPQSHTISLKSSRSRGMVLTKKGWQKLKQAEVFCDRYGNRYTYEALAAQSVLSPRTVSKILNCSVPVDKRTLIMFFNAFHLQLESDDYKIHKIIVTE